MAECLICTINELAKRAAGSVTRALERAHSLSLSPGQELCRCE